MVVTQNGIPPPPSPVGFRGLAGWYPDSDASADNLLSDGGSSARADSDDPLFVAADASLAADAAAVFVRDRLDVAGIVGAAALSLMATSIPDLRAVAAGCSATISPS